MRFWLVRYWVGDDDRGSWVNYKMYPEKTAAEQARKQLKQSGVCSVCAVEEWVQDVEGVLTPVGAP